MGRKKRNIIIAVTLLLLLAFLYIWFSFAPRYMRTDVHSTKGSHYELVLPSSLKPAYFNDNASLQYQDADKDLSVMVIDESKATILSYGLDYDLETYMKIATRALDSAGMYVNKPMTINGNKALQCEVKQQLKEKGKVVHYVLTCIETNRNYYQVVLWSDESRMSGEREEMDKIISSFHEVDK